MACEVIEAWLALFPKSRHLDQLEVTPRFGNDEFLAYARRVGYEGGADIRPYLEIIGRLELILPAQDDFHI